MPTAPSLCLSKPTAHSLSALSLSALLSAPSPSASSASGDISLALGDISLALGDISLTLGDISLGTLVLALRRKRW